MKIVSLLRNLIVESARFNVLYDKYVKPKTAQTPGKKDKGLMDFITLKTIIFADPTTRKPENFDIEGASEKDMDKVQPGRYTNWLLRSFEKPKLSELGLPEDEVDTKSKRFQEAYREYLRLFMEDLHKTTEDLQKFERAKQYLPQEQRDINKYTPKTLFDTLDGFQIPEKKKKELEKKEAKASRKGFEHAGSEIIYQGPKWTLVKISDTGVKGQDAAIYFGGSQQYEKGETRWCTSAPGLTWFNNYIKDGPLYVVLPNDDEGKVGQLTGLPQKRYQFHFPSSQFMDRKDHQINLVEMLNGEMVELKEFFKDEFAKGLVQKGGQKVEINYPDSSAGKFIALYGFEELFQSLPDDIEHLLIHNKSKEKIELDVPSSVTRFKKVQALLFQNICKSLPENLGEMSNLTILSLPNNNNLTSLPASLANTKSLTFINLKDSNPNVKIPDVLKQKMENEGNGFFYITQD